MLETPNGSNMCRRHVFSEETPRRDEPAIANQDTLEACRFRVGS